MARGLVRRRRKYLPAEVLKPGIRSLTARALREVSWKRAAEEVYVEVRER